MTKLSSIQSEIISNHPYHLPRFEPHVTLIGGVSISDVVSKGGLSSFQNTNSAQPRDIHDVAGEIVLRRLQRAFRSHGGIACNFVEERGVFAARALSTSSVDDGGEGDVQWNQSCVSIMERSSSFMRAMQVADEALFSTDTLRNNNNETSASLSIERHFKPPLFEPHYSFVYGNDADRIPPSLECPQSFVSTEMVVMWTHPSSLDGVEKWQTIGRVCLI